MAQITHLKLITLVFSFFFSSSDGLKITTRLIHRDSIFSPHFNASLTTADLAKRMVGASLARHSSSVLLRPSDDEAGGEQQDITPELLWTTKKHDVVFYVNFSIGDPPVPQLAMMDTGSNLLWVRCPPCTPHCSSRSGATYFYTWHSKTYSPLPCTNDKNCAMCTSSEACMFKIEYPKAISTGVYATEQLTFRTNDDDTNMTIVPNVLFGCSEIETGGNDIDPSANGIMGLSYGYKESSGRDLLPEERDPLISRLGGKFSYCIGTTTNRSYPHNRLSFGDAASFLGKSTPLFSSHGYYYIDLNNISIGDSQMMNIDPVVFKHGTIIDSGAELTILRPEAIDAVKEEVRREAESLNVHEVRPPLQVLELCYKGTIEEEGNGFKSFGFHFNGGAELKVDKYGMFLQVTEDIFCLAIMRFGLFQSLWTTGQEKSNFCPKPRSQTPKPIN
ncbi:Aspartic proteinase CDR1 [Linum grandiflorum]